MGEGEILEQTRPLAAPFVFFIVFAFQFATKRLQDLKRGASKTYKEMQLRGEIKQLLKEAASYSQPSTFAQAAKLRRMAAAKEKELANYQAHLTQEVKQSYDLYLKVLFIAKVFVHIVLVLWFWSSPVASVSQHLVQPFGRLLSWKIWGSSGNHVRHYSNRTLNFISGFLLLIPFVYNMAYLKEYKSISRLGSYPGWYCVLGLASVLVDSPE